MRELNRRTALAAFAASAIIVPGFAIAGTVPSSLADCGRQFDELYPELLIRIGRQNEFEEAYAPESEKNRTWPEDQALWSRGDGDAYAEAYCRMYNETDFGKLGDAVDEIFQRLDKMSLAVSAMPARTVEDLAVKARFVFFHASNYWNGPLEYLDYPEQQARMFIEAALTAAKVPIPGSWVETLTA